MEELRQSIENTEQHLQLTDILKKLFRTPSIQGMEGEKVVDPIAQEILSTGPENLEKIEFFLKENNITNIVPLEQGHGFSAVVLEANDKVVRLSRQMSTSKPNAPHVLQPLAVEIIGGVSVQISKKLNTINITEDDVQKVQDDLKTAGYRWDDAGPDNLGRDENGNIFILDGSIIKL